MTDKSNLEVSNIIDKYHSDKGALIQILLDIQQKEKWLSKESLSTVAEKLSVPLTWVYHAATFYKAFSLEPRGRHTITVCLGTACHVRGAPVLLDRVAQKLNIEVNKTTKDKKFTLATVNCIGCCALGPVLSIDDKYYSNPSGTELDNILNSYE
ncbi:MAG: NAD(P)H-dependent oxidoreductase subunit E [Planctomycetes bacterium]|nr:NAD(P)H-dependent oxidoreductase subunit E [Planctomycetota bacterium]